MGAVGWLHKKIVETIFSKTLFQTGLQERIFKQLGTMRNQISQTFSFDCRCSEGVLGAVGWLPKTHLRQDFRKNLKKHDLNKKSFSKISHKNFLLIADVRRT